MREKIRLRDGWLFHQGEISIIKPCEKGPVYMQAKNQECRTGAASVEYHDQPNDFSEKGELTTEKWEWVCVPHDYMIQQIPSNENNFALGGYKYENAWYRYHFSVSEKDIEKRISFYFEGITGNSTIYLNGCRLAQSISGYVPFEVEITDFINFQGDNVLAIYVDVNSRHEGWWYEGGGIYRDVWMVKTDKVFVDVWGVCLIPEKQEGESWFLPAKVTLCNAGELLQSVEVQMEIYPSGLERNKKLVKKACLLKAGEKREIELPFFWECPRLWDTEDPFLYNVITKILRNGREIDKVENRFGFRSIAFDAERGFFLNGRHVYIKGVNCHQDYGLTGKAVPDRVHRYKLKLIKEMGANGYRCSHYPQSDVTMDALDEMGFLVIDETRLFSSSAEGLREVDVLVRRDRNHPSVIMWSIGNEEPWVKTEAGKRITCTMKNYIKKLDISRPVMAAVCHQPEEAIGVMPLDVLGINYSFSSYEICHQRYPDLPLVASECCATGTTRGWYSDDWEEKGYLSAYDKDTTENFLSREKSWKFFMAHPYIMGCYQWDAIEHRGESVWPRLCSQSGAIDLYLQKKDAFYQNQSHWLSKPMVHLMPHWNQQGQEGEPIQVIAYSNCERLELFLNGRSQGKRIIEKYGHGEWEVPFEVGRLEVIAVSNDGVEVSDIVETSGVPVRLRLRLEDGEDAGDEIKADGRDVAIITCYCEDEAGRLVPDASPEILFLTNRMGKILGTGSDVSDQIPPIRSVRKMRAGLCAAVVEAGTEKGILEIRAIAEGLLPGILKIKIN